jgi:hypothetical protein
MTALIRYDAACRALAEAKAVEEVKDVRDQGTAMKLYVLKHGLYAAEAVGFRREIAQLLRTAKAMVKGVK